MKLPRRKFLHLTVGAAALPVMSRIARAQGYPTRPVRIVVPYAAGTSPDIIARLVGQALSERLGQQVIIENRTGAGGNIGTEAVVRASPDGYTLLLTTGANATNAALYERLNFDFIRDNRLRTRHLLNQEFMQALLLNFRHEGKKAIEKVARNQPAVYVKILALLVPREMQVEHTNRIKQMTDEGLEAAVELLQGMIDAKLAGANAKLVEGIAEPVALPAPDVVSERPNHVMDAADTAVGARKRKPGKSKVPSPAGT